MLARHHEQIGLLYCYLADMRQARRHLIKAIAGNPRRPVTYFQLVSSLFGRYGLRLFLKTGFVSRMSLKRIRSRSHPQQTNLQGQPK